MLEIIRHVVDTVATIFNAGGDFSSRLAGYYFIYLIAKPYALRLRQWILSKLYR